MPLNVACSIVIELGYILILIQDTKFYSAYKQEAAVSSGAMIVAGLILVGVGILLIVGILQFILTILGWIALVAGVVFGVVGLIQVFSGNKDRY